MKSAKFMKNHIIKQVLTVAVVAVAVAALTQTAGATPHPLVPTAPDAGSSAGLLGLACAGLAMIRKIRR
jgi:hypothetical protein